MRAETEIRTERGSIAPRKVFAHPEVFVLNILLSIISGTFWKITEVSKKFLYPLESFQIVLNVSDLSGKFWFCLEILCIEGLESFQFFWKVTKLSGKFPERLESFQIVCKVSIFS